MKFSYTAVWDQSVSLARANLPLLVAIAGAFIFLPNLLIGHFIPEPEPGGSDINVLLDAWNIYWRANWHWLLLDLIANVVGTLAILILVFDNRRPTVAAALVGALTLLPFYLVASFLAGLILLAGFIALIVPGLYLYGRLAPLAPVVVAEGRRNPIDAIRRCFEITKGYGWTITGLILVVALAASLLILAVRMISGLLLIVVLGQDLGTFIVLVIGTALNALLTTVLALLAASIYRQIAGDA
jgi:hypothetical protein